MTAPWTYYRTDPAQQAISTGWSQGRLYPPMAVVGNLQLRMNADPTQGVSTAVEVNELPHGEKIALSSWGRITEDDPRAEWLRRAAYFYDEMQRCFDPFPD